MMHPLSCIDIPLSWGVRMSTVITMSVETEHNRMHRDSGRAEMSV